MIPLKSPGDIKRVRESSRIVAQALRLAKERARRDMTTAELNELIERFIVRQGGRPAFKGFCGFPASSCVSINEQVVHGIPGGRRLEKGDIVSVDIGVEKDSFFGDGAITFGIGTIDSRARDLMQACRQALLDGIEMARPGNRLSDISHAVQATTEVHGYGVVRDLVGHGIGKQMH
jgi:methionyl aminopeptidase